MSITLSEQEIEFIKNIFNQFDRNKNGHIEKKELQTLAIALNDPLSQAELMDFFKAIDKDNSSQITWEEFIQYWSSK
jgi:Ca2+-binding EF-hand superfamily protein|tara:strand:+ start:708 stop:938 length:231 start_codon:yes stop_codon:yes gene_type:complete